MITIASFEVANESKSNTVTGESGTGRRDGMRDWDGKDDWRALRT